MFFKFRHKTPILVRWLQPQKLTKMPIDQDIDLTGQKIIIDSYIHKKATLTKEKFLERVTDVKEIRTLSSDHYISFYICSLEEFENLKKFYDLINHWEFDFKNYYAFGIAIQPKLYNWFKNTEYSIIEKQIVFWIASHYFFVPSKR